MLENFGDMASLGLPTAKPALISWLEEEEGQFLLSSDEEEGLAGTNLSPPPRPSDDRGIPWREKETADLIRIWGEQKVQIALAGSHKNIDVYEKVAKEMQALAHPRTAMECRTKMDALQMKYRQVVAHNQEAGNSPVTCTFFKELHRILRDDGSAQAKGMSRCSKDHVTINAGNVRCSTPTGAHEPRVPPESQERNVDLDETMISLEDDEDCAPVAGETASVRGVQPISAAKIQTADPPGYSVSRNRTDCPAKLFGVRGVSWREQETADLISIWGSEEIQDALAITHKNIDVYEKVAKQMKQLGHTRSAVECRTKTKGLRHEYRRVVAYNKETGNPPATCPFYKELDRFLCDDGTARAKRLSRRYKLKLAPTEQPPPETESFSSHDLVTMNVVDVRCSDPIGDHTPEIQPPATFEPQRLAADPDLTALKHDPEEDPEPHDGAGASISAGSHVRAAKRRVVNIQERENEAAPQSPLAETSPQSRLQAIRKRPRVAVLSDMSEKLVRQSQLEHKQMMEKMDQFLAADRRKAVEAERDRIFLNQAFEKNLEVMRSAVEVMSGMREILLKFTSRSMPAERPQRPSSLAENSQQSTECIPPSQDSPAQLQVADNRPSQHIPDAQDNMPVQSTACGSPRLRRCRSQKRDRYSP